MLKKVIEGAHVHLGAPEGWNAERDGPCDALPVRVTRAADGSLQHCESAWEPTRAELAALNAGGHLVLRVWGGQPPVSLYVEPAKVSPLIRPRVRIVSDGTPQGTAVFNSDGTFIPGIEAVEWAVTAGPNPRFSRATLRMLNVEIDAPAEAAIPPSSNNQG